MSRGTALDENWETGVPRASGDEPFFLENDGKVIKCSPRERG